MNCRTDEEEENVFLRQKFAQMSIPGKIIKDITSEDAVYGTRFRHSCWGRIEPPAFPSQTGLRFRHSLVGRDWASGIPVSDGIVLALAGCAFPFPLAAGALKSLWHSILGFVVAGLSQLNACGIFGHFCFFRPRASSVRIKQKTPSTPC